MNERLNDALNEISDRHIAEAAAVPRKKHLWWMGAAAAVLAAAILIFVLSGPMTIQAKALALPGDARISQRPDIDDFPNRDAWKTATNIWEAERKARSTAKQSALSALTPFFTKGSAVFLASDNAENRLWSPVNAYIGLAMAAELAEGESRQQILELFGAADTAAVRNQVSAVWESVFEDGKHERCILANSLWLEEGLSYNQDALDTLAYHYYASVYTGDLGSSQINRAIGAWLNNNTGGLLKNAADGISLDQGTLLALYSTLYFQAKWSDEFSSKNNTEDVFHAPGSDKQVTYMNKKLNEMYYYWGDDFSAVSLGLKNGSAMWFILPDEGLSVSDVLESGNYMKMVLDETWENKKYMKVNLSIPKFDVTGTQNLRSGLEQLGVTDIFSPSSADLSAVSADVPLYFTAANQSVRVQIDEEGVKAAAYIELPAAMSPPPPDEIIDFILDRPFLFMITSSNVPLFAGAVNTP